jgi:hypothetical protein
VALLAANNAAAAQAAWSWLGLGSEAVRADLRKVISHANLAFDFTNGRAVPHLWTALRAISFGKTSNRR